MMHCGGGTGPDAFNATLGIPPRPPSDDPQHDLFSALIAWTEKGEALDRITATKFSNEYPGKIDLQRPLCPYPQRAVYRGTDRRERRAASDARHRPNREVSIAASSRAANNGD